MVRRSRRPRGACAAFSAALGRLSVAAHRSQPGSLLLLRGRYSPEPGATAALASEMDETGSRDSIFSELEESLEKTRGVYTRSSDSRRTCPSRSAAKVCPPHLPDC